MSMTNVTRILSRIEQGDPSAAEHLLPLVYEELRRLAAAKLTDENPGQTIQATALVHDAYLRLCLTSCLMWIAATSNVSADVGAELIEAKKVWNQRRRLAATDLVRFKDSWYCVLEVAKLRPIDPCRAQFGRHIPTGIGNGLTCR